MDSRTKTASSNSRVGEQTEQTSIEAHQEKIIQIQMRNFMYDNSTNKVVPRTHYKKSIYESQVPDHIKMMEQDSMNQIPNR